MELAMQDVEIRETQPRPIDGARGGALEVQARARLTGSDVRIAENRFIGLLTGNGDVSVQLDRVSILNTAEQGCAETTCPDRPFGAGALILDGAATIQRFVVRGAPQCGVHVAQDGELDLADGEVAQCSIGACIQRSGYDPARLSNEVSYRDNGVNLDATTLPVPELGEPPVPREP
jgi:hypothetical protein